MTQLRIDLNSDVGESFGAWRLGRDEALIPHVTSVNVACGFHAGDPVVMTRTVELARQHGVAVGAHPGYPDLPGFGRRDLEMTADELRAALLYQLGALAGVARAAGVELRHVKAHGALYNRAARDSELARTLAEAVLTFSRELVLVGLAGSRMLANLDSKILAGDFAPGFRIHLQQKDLRLASEWMATVAGASVKMAVVMPDSPRSTRNATPKPSHRRLRTDRRSTHARGRAHAKRF